MSYEKNLREQLIEAAKRESAAELNEYQEFFINNLDALMSDIVWQQTAQKLTLGTGRTGSFRARPLGTNATTLREFRNQKYLLGRLKEDKHLASLVIKDGEEFDGSTYVMATVFNVDLDTQELTVHQSIGAAAWAPKDTYKIASENYPLFEIDKATCLEQWETLARIASEWAGR